MQEQNQADLNRYLGIDKLIKFEPSWLNNKKYVAHVIVDGKRRVVHFGDSRYQHYRDNTPLKLFSALDHNDLKRRRSYRARHANNTGIAGRLALYYLW